MEIDGGKESFVNKISNTRIKLRPNRSRLNKAVKKIWKMMNKNHRTNYNKSKIFCTSKPHQ